MIQFKDLYQTLGRWKLFKWNLPKHPHLGQMGNFGPIVAQTTVVIFSSFATCYGTIKVEDCFQWSFPKNPLLGQMSRMANWLKTMQACISRSVLRILSNFAAFHLNF